MKRAAVVVADSAQTKRDLIDFVQIDPDKASGDSSRPESDVSRRIRRAGATLAPAFGLGDAKLILQIGRGFYKNLPAVLRVLRRLRRDGLDVRVVRVGPQAERRRSGRWPSGWASLGVLELGRFADADLPALYNAVDVLCFLRCTKDSAGRRWRRWHRELPVVCSRAGSLDEVVGDAALTADPEDVEALAWHVGTVLTDPALREAAGSARPGSTRRSSAGTGRRTQMHRRVPRRSWQAD